MTIIHASSHTPLKIIYMGTPGFAVAPLRAILEAGYNIVAVVTAPDKASGRGLKINESEVKKYAESQNLTILQPTSLKDPDFIKALRNINADLFIVVAFRMLPKEVWSMPKLGTFNLHGSLLPDYRGAAPINWAIINADKETGVTTFLIDDKIDTGAILLQAKCNIEDNDNFETLHNKLMHLGSDLVLKSIEQISSESIQPKAQSEFVAKSELRPAPKLNKDLCKINWDNKTMEISNLIRGLSPYPACFSTMVSSDGQETIVKIYKAKPIMEKHSLKSGRIIRRDKSSLLIATIDGFISLESIQLAGKKRLDITTFLAGFRNPESYHFSNK